MSVQGELAPDTGRFAIMRQERKSSQPFAAQGRPCNRWHRRTGVTVPQGAGFADPSSGDPAPMLRMPEDGREGA